MESRAAYPCGSQRARSCHAILAMFPCGAYAFSWTPYELRTTPEEVQKLFDQIAEFILPTNLHHKILDWGGGDLSKVSPYFAAGMEW